MELDFNKIIRLKKIRIEKSELSEEENTLASPILRDKSLIRDIYKIFVELLNSRSLPPCIDLAFRTTLPQLSISTCVVGTCT